MHLYCGGDGSETDVIGRPPDRYKTRGRSEGGGGPVCGQYLVEVLLEAGPTGGRNVAQF